MHSNVKPQNRTDEVNFMMIFFFQKKVGDLIKDIEQSTNTELWQFLSVAIDRLGLVLFTITLIGGSSYVWSAK